MRWLVVLAACAPTVDGPIAAQRARDGEDAARLAAQVRALPGVVRVEAALHRPARDPFTPDAPAGGTMAIVVDDAADQAAIRRDALALAPVPVTIALEVGAKHVELATVGPFTVDAGSRLPLKVALSVMLALAAAGSGAMAVRLRRKT